MIKKLLGISLALILSTLLISCIDSMVNKENIYSKDANPPIVIFESSSRGQFAVITSEHHVLIWGGLPIGDGTSLGSDTIVDITSYFDLNEEEVIVSLSLGASHCSAVTSDGRLFMWGYNNFGQIGDGTYSKRLTPIDITSQFSLALGEKIISASLGYNHSSAITSEGRILTWGYNGDYQLGDGTTINRSQPIEITVFFNLNSEEKIISVATAPHHSAALTSEGRLFTWGQNSVGALGDGTDINKSKPTDITSQFNLLEEEIISSIFLGDDGCSAALTSDGRLFSWGNNRYGVLGTGDENTKRIPTEITSRFDLDSEETIISFAFGTLHAAIVTSQGRVFTWGSNGFYQLGDGSGDNSLSPIDITSNFNLNSEEYIINVFLGSLHSSALTSNGRVFTWGNNTSQLGYDAMYYQKTPNLVLFPDIE